MLCDYDRRPETMGLANNPKAAIWIESRMEALGIHG